MSHHLHSELPPHLSGVLPDGVGPYFLGRTPPWQWNLILTMALGLVLTGLAFAAAQTWQGRASWSEAGLAAFCLPFLLLLLLRRTWQSPVSLIADRRGLHFLHGTGARDCSFLPWQHTGQITIERIASRMRITLLVLDAAPFWDASKQSQYALLLLPPVDRAGYRKLRLEQVVGNVHQALATLESLRASSTTALTRANDSRRREDVHSACAVTSHSVI